MKYLVPVAILLSALLSAFAFGFYVYWRKEVCVNWQETCVGPKNAPGVW
jgi:hypothetical protein